MKRKVTPKKAKRTSLQEWLNKLKIAIAEEDIESIGQLFEKQLPKATQDELVQAAHLASEALAFIEREKNTLAGTINKIKTAREFFKA